MWPTYSIHPAFGFVKSVLEEDFALRSPNATNGGLVLRAPAHDQGAFLFGRRSTDSKMYKRERIE